MYDDDPDDHEWTHLLRAAWRVRSDASLSRRVGLALAVINPATEEGHRLTIDGELAGIFATVPDAMMAVALAIADDVVERACL